MMDILKWLDNNGTQEDGVNSRPFLPHIKMKITYECYMGLIAETPKVYTSIRINKSN